MEKNKNKQNFSKTETSRQDKLKGAELPSKVAQL